MPDEIEVAGSRAGDDAGAVFKRAPGPDPYGDEGFSQFRERIGDLGKDKALEPIKNFEGAIKTLIEGQKMIGGSLRLPGKDLSDEQRTQAVTELKGKLREAGILEAVPDAPDKYTINMPQIEGWQVNQGLYDSFRNVSHKLAVTPSQAQGYFDWYIAFQAEADAQEAAEFEKMRENLKTEWGALHPRKMEAARRAGIKYLGQDAEDIIAQLPPSVSHRIVKAFAQIGDPLLEDDIIIGEHTPYESLESIEKKINELTRDSKGPYWDQSHPNHKAVQEEYQRLNKARSIIQIEQRRR